MDGRLGTKEMPYTSGRRQTDTSENGCAGRSAMQTGFSLWSCVRSPPSGFSTLSGHPDRGWQTRTGQKRLRTVDREAVGIRTRSTGAPRNFSLVLTLRSSGTASYRPHIAAPERFRVRVSVTGQKLNINYALPVCRIFGRSSNSPVMKRPKLPGLPSDPRGSNLAWYRIGRLLVARTIFSLGDWKVAFPS